MPDVKTNVPGAVTPAMLERFRKGFEAEPVHKITMNALTRNVVTNIAQDCSVLNDFDFVFSNEIEINGPPQDQERAGTCWLFAALNLLRWEVAKELNKKDFTFSPNYHEFFDKVEKANWFLEKMIEYRDRDRLDRHLVYLLQRPIGDGGDWLYTVNCVAKYGMVPMSAMPDTFNLKNTRFMNEKLAYKCRQGALAIRRLHAAGKPVSQLRKAKEEIMAEVYNILAMFLGVPPKKFNWAYWDDGAKPKKGKKGKKGAKPKKKFHRFTNMTPKQFTDRFLKLNPDDYVTLLHLPAEGFKYNKPYYMEFGQNTVGAADQLFLNVPMKAITDASVKSIKAGEPVLYSSEAGPGTEAKHGFYHHSLYDYESLLNMEFPLNKADRVTIFEEQCNHLQLFIGVDLVKNKPVKWKLENSWGKQYGKNGLFMMSQKWFEEYVFTVLLHKRFVPASLRKHLKKEPELIPLGAPFS